MYFALLAIAAAASEGGLAAAEPHPGAAPGVVAPAPSSPSGAAPTPPARAKLIGLGLHAGVPDGFVLSAVVRPVRWARASAGLAHNVLGLGVQGGVTLLPLQLPVTPTLHLTIGRFFETDVSDDFSGTFPTAFDPSLRKFGYTFYSAQLGLEVGSRSDFSFFLRGGLAWVRSGLDGVENFRDPDRPNTTVNVSDVDLKATTPTVNLGFVWHVW